MSEPARLQWVDSARGACVFAVVLFHVCSWQYLPMTDTVWAPASSIWGSLNSYLGWVRMPLLMAISGMLAGRRIGEGWGRPGAAVRAASSYYLYVVWLAVYAAFYLAARSSELPHQIDSVGQFLLELLIPQTPLWYVFALALYVVVLTSLRRVRPVIVLTALAVLSVAVQAIAPDWPMFEKVPVNAVYFAIGVYGGRQLRALAERRRISDLLILSPVALGLAVILTLWSFGPVLDGAFQVLGGVMCIVLGVVVVVQLIRWRPVGTLAEFVGRRTLQIYVLHIPLIFVVLLVLTEDRVRDLGGVLQNPIVAALWPVALAALVIGTALAVHRLLMVCRLKVLFEMPAAFRLAINGTYAKRSAAVGAGDRPSPRTDRSERRS